MPSHKKMILLVCGGNTCRSPMAKVILEQKLKAAGLSDLFDVDSAAYDGPTCSGASDNARAAVKKLFGEDLLASHKAKKLAPGLVAKADLILVMAARMKNSLPTKKTWTLKEYAGSSGDVRDPIGGGLEVYLSCAGEISEALDAVVAKLSVVSL
ncbi:MAG: low molecular weight protein arginine phosphatase [Pseudomonadota bacterium]